MINDNKNLTDNSRNYIYSILINDNTASSSTLSTTAVAPNYIKNRHLNSSSHNNFINNNNNNYINNINSNNVKQNNENNSDRYLAYRQLCEIRTRRLERYKKARSFCSLHDENNTNNFNYIKTKNAPKNINIDYGKLDNSTRVTSSSCSHLANEINEFSQSDNLTNKTQNNEFINNLIYLNKNANAFNQNDLLFLNNNNSKLVPNDYVYPLQNSVHNNFKKILTANLSNEQNKNFVNNNSSQINRKQTFESTIQQQPSLNCQYEILREKMVSFIFKLIFSLKIINFDVKKIFI